MQKAPPREIHTWVTHKDPHIDELLAILLVRIFGAGFFKLASRMEHMYVTWTIDSSFVKKYPNHLFLGVGLDQFDDHGRVEDQRSCCELMAEYLGIHMSPRLKKLIDAVSFQDKKRVKKDGKKRSLPTTFPKTVSLMFRYTELTLDQVQEWVNEALLALIASEEKFLEQITAEVNADMTIAVEKRKREIHKRFDGTERPWFYLTLDQVAQAIPEERRAAWLEFAQPALKRQSDCFKLAKAVAPNHMGELDSRFGPVKILAVDCSQKGNKYEAFCLEFDTCSRTSEIAAGIVLVRNHLGHTLIAVNEDNFPGYLKTFVMRLRYAEVWKRRHPLPHQVMERLGDEGTILEFPVFHVHEGIGFTRIYSGSTTRDAVDLSDLTVDEILGLLVDWLKGVEINYENIVQLPVEEVQRRMKALCAAATAA